MTRLAIAQLVPALDLGGVERGTLEIGRAIVAAGHRSIVISDGGRLVKRLVREGSEHIEWPIGAKSPLTLRFTAKLDALMRAQRIDIIHARSRVPAWIGWLAWRRMPPAMRPRLVTTVHGMYSVSRYSEVMTYGERVIAVSRAVADYISRAYPRCLEDRVRIIPNGVSAQEFPYGYVPDPGWRNRWEHDCPFVKGKRLVTLISRITGWKGHELFIEVLAKLGKTHRDAHGLIVGTGRPRRMAALKRLATRLDAPVSLLGRRDDVREIIASSALVVSTSTQPEAFGRTVLEALRLGTPVAGFDHGGVGEILSDVFPPGRVAVGDVNALTERIAHFLDNPPRVPRSDAYSLDATQSSTIRLYEELARIPPR
ncbi:MAG: glycosyltransferase family 4 protein [Gammaproteobacteria bacterium]|nr:glycosyltransferase family 4 protein [Gammaproteobacteria bacterium]